MALNSLTAQSLTKFITSNHIFFSIIITLYNSQNKVIEPCLSELFCLKFLASFSQVLIAVAVVCFNGFGADFFSIFTTEVSSSLSELSAFRLRTFPFLFAFLKNVHETFSFALLSSAITVCVSTFRFTVFLFDCSLYSGGSGDSFNFEDELNSCLTILALNEIIHNDN